MTKAIKSLRGNSMTVFYGFPISTLRNKVKGLTPKVRKMDPPTILSDAEECHLIGWIGQIAKAGFPLIKEDVLVIVEKNLSSDGRITPFKNDKLWRQMVSCIYTSTSWNYKVVY